MCKVHHPLGILSTLNLTALCIYSQVLWSMLREHHYLSMCIEPPRTYLRHWISIFTQTWWSPVADWMKASLNSTNILFQRIYKLLDNKKRLMEGKRNLWKMQEQVWTDKKTRQIQQEQNKHIVPSLKSKCLTTVRAFECPAARISTLKHLTWSNIWVNAITKTKTFKQVQLCNISVFKCSRIFVTDFNLQQYMGACFIIRKCIGCRKQCTIKEKIKGYKMVQEFCKERRRRIYPEVDITQLSNTASNQDSRKGKVTRYNIGESKRYKCSMCTFTVPSKEGPEEYHGRFCFKSTQ